MKTEAEIEKRINDMKAIKDRYKNDDYPSFGFGEWSRANHIQITLEWVLNKQ